MQVLKEGLLVALLTETKEEAPWLGRVMKIDGDSITLVWLEGQYNTKWKPCKVKIRRRMVEWEDTVRKDSIILSGFSLNKNNKLDNNTVQLLKETYNSYF